MERKVEKALIGWKNSANRLPLILQGARQVGKTFILLAFGKKFYNTVHYFNFESNSQLASIFERDLNPERILRELSVISGERIREKDSLIFFDEVQVCEHALTSLRYFAELAPGHHVVAAGSLPGIAINREKFSFPVGKVQVLNLYPLDFEEFLMAKGQQDAISLIRDFYAHNSPCPLHHTFMDFYRQYLFTGGMPHVVKEFLENNATDLVPVLQKSIDNAYLADMAKYAGKEETVRIMAAYQSIPAQLARENKKFQYKMIKKGARSAIYETALDWLRNSGIVIRCAKTVQGKFPVNAFADPSSFKLYMNDPGLLCAKYGVPMNFILSESDFLYPIKGILAENYVACALQTNGYEIYYWESQAKAEIDFLIQTRGGEIIPVEVKSSEHVRSKSLHQFVSLYKPPFSIRVSAKNFGFENNIKSIPLYAVFCI